MHPDALLPCQSFHFGPTFHGNPGGEPQVVAEVNNVIIGQRNTSQTQSSSATQQTGQQRSPAAGTILFKRITYPSLSFLIVVLIVLSICFIFPFSIGNQQQQVDLMNLLGNFANMSNNGGRNTNSSQGNVVIIFFILKSIYCFN